MIENSGCKSSEYEGFEGDRSWESGKYKFMMSPRHVPWIYHINVNIKYVETSIGTITDDKQ